MSGREASEEEILAVERELAALPRTGDTKIGEGGRLLVYVEIDTEVVGPVELRLVECEEWLERQRRRGRLDLDTPPGFYHHERFG